MKYLLSLVLVSLVAFTVNAQEKTPAPATPAQAAQKAPALGTQRPAMQRPGMQRPGMQRPGMQQQAAAAPKGDTVKLKAAFKELYPLIKPAQTVKERTEMSLRNHDRMFKSQGIDSAKAHDSVMSAINPNMDEEILYNAYAENFTPDEIKSLATFFKSPAGKHYLEVEQRLIAAKGQTDQYINRTIQVVTAPMRKPIERRPPGAPGAPNTPGIPGRPHPGMRPMPGQSPQGNAPGGQTPPAEPAPAPIPTEPQH